MISFYPGPSKVEEKISEYVREAQSRGMLSMNHRSPEFIDLSRKTLEHLREKLNVPDSYQILYVSSATESWEIIAQSLIQKNSLHLFNGAFGEKWHQYTQKLCPKAAIASISFLPDQLPDLSAIPQAPEMICITHNETSNGSTLPTPFLNELRAKYPESLIAADATSSLAGVDIEMSLLDLCYASVQKCFGLPAGMGILICSPRAVEHAYQINERDHYNSLPFLLDKIKDYQTTYTPNVLNIFLLMKVMESRPAIFEVEKRLRQRSQLIYKVLEELKQFKALIENPTFRSHSVISVKAKEAIINRIKSKARASGMILGNGYGTWKENTFRIANFPAHRDEEIQKLLHFLKAFDSSIL